MSGAANASAYHPTLAYRADIDGLRGIAVSMVVLFHAVATWLPGGFVGVDVFFVISGFLISKIIYQERRDGTFTYARFYRRRIRRLLPAFLVVVLAVAGLSWWLSLPDHMVDTGQSIFAAGAFSTNILFWHEVDYFAGPADLKPLLHTWSLAVEEQFYFVYPVLLLIGMKLWRRHGAMAVTLAIFLVSFALSALLTRDQPTAAFFLLPFRAWELMLGSLLAISGFRVPGGAMVRNIAVLAGIAMIAASGFAIGDATPFPGYAAMLPVAGSALVLASAGTSDTASRILLQNRPLVFIGKISYSLYLWHWPLLAFARYRSVDETPGGLVAALVALAVVLSILSYYFVEQPFRRPGRLDGWKPFAFAIASSLAMFAIGGAMIRTDGAPQRFAPEIRSLMEIRADRDKGRKCLTSERRPLMPKDACSFGDEKAVPTIALWGDSHAHAMVDAFGREAEDRGLSLRFFGFAGCPPLVDVTSPMNALCARWRPAALKEIVDDENIRTVVILARHSAHMLGQTGDWGPAEGVEKANAFSNLPEDERIRRYLAAMDSTAAKLRAAGKKIVFVEPVPEVGYDVPRVAALMKMDGGNIDAFTRPKAMYVARQSDIRAQMEVLAKDTGVALVDPASWLCDEDRCIVSQDGQPLYYDDDHLAGPGGARVAKDTFDVMDEKGWDAPPGR